MPYWTMFQIQRWSVLYNEREYSGYPRLIYHTGNAHNPSTLYTSCSTCGLHCVCLAQPNVEGLLHRRSENGDSVSFPEMAVMSQPGFSIGAHAMRGLIFSRPTRIQVS